MFVIERTLPNGDQALLIYAADHIKVDGNEPEPDMSIVKNYWSGEINMFVDGNPVVVEED